MGQQPPGTTTIGLILDREAHVTLLPHDIRHVIGWPLIGSGALLGGWFRRTMRHADALVRTDVVEDGVKDRAQGVSPGPPGSTRSRQVRLYARPLFLGEVGWARLSHAC